MSQSPPSLPPSVRLHPDGDISQEEIRDETKGWRQFVSEEWAENEDSLSQRYKLMERWATADQSFRDVRFRLSNNQTKDSLEIQRFVCLAPANRDPHQKNSAHLLKILILLYIVQDGYMVHPFSFRTAGKSPTPQIPVFITSDDENSSPLAVEHLLATLFLRTADFRVVAMTRTGTALFTTECNSLWYVLDGSSLETGLIHVVTFKPNGEIHNATQRRPFNLTQIMIFHIGNGWPLSVLIENNVGGRSWHNKPMDLDLPILDLLQTVKDRGESQYTDWGSREMWASEIERAAPGYLQLEGEGKEGEFALESLAELE
ncbi:hypothetical protein ATERTT37_003366 [Aspergillus terreus]